MNEYIGAVLLSQSLPGQLQVCGPAKPGNHCLKFPNFWLLKFHVHYQLWFLYVFVFVSKIDICHMYRSQSLLWRVWGRYWFENRSLDFGYGSQHSWGSDFFLLLTDCTNIKRLQRAPDKSMSPEVGTDNLVPQCRDRGRCLEFWCWRKTKMIGGLNKEIQNRIQVIDCL